MAQNIVVQNKTPTREEQIEQHQAEHDRRMENVREFNVQLTKLKLSKLVMQKEKAQEVEATLDTFPETSAKGMLDKILQIPMQKETQLNENITKLELAIENETRRARESLGKKKAIENQIKDEKIDAHTKTVDKNFNTFLDAYKYCRDIFYNKLAPSIQEGYDLEPDYYRRFEKLGLNKSIMISIQHHFRHGEKVYLIDVLDKIMNLSDAYGPALLEKDFFAGSWPDDAQSDFFANI